jgi:hypothetical protein
MGLLTVDPYFTMTNAVFVETVLIYTTVIIGVINSMIGRELIDSYQCSLDSISFLHRVNLKKFLAFLLIIICLLMVTVLGVFLDVLNSHYVSPTSEITFWGFTATKQEWFQNVFLVGFITLLIPFVGIVFYIAGKQQISFTKLIILLCTVYPLMSAFWDILFYYLFVIPLGIPADSFVAWFDPFNLALQSLGTIILEQGFIAMDVEGMLYFAYIRLLIFVPLLAYELYK